MEFSGNRGLHAWWPRTTLGDAACYSSLAASMYDTGDESQV